MKASVYLTEKADAFIQAMRFFHDGGHRATERRMVFLSQIDFWDWEMENLVFSFDTFLDRQKQWQSYGSLEQALTKQGFLLRENIMERGLNQTRNRERDVAWGVREQVVAPYDKLREAVDAWNKVLDLCEKMIDPHSKNDFLKIAVHKDLSKFRRVIEKVEAQ